MYASLNSYLKEKQTTHNALIEQKCNGEQKLQVIL